MRNRKVTGSKSANKLKPLFQISAHRTFVDELASQLNIAVSGIIDSISVHKTFPLLVSNGEISWLTFKIFAANSCLLVGSALLYKEAILPGLAHIRNSIVVDDLGLNGNNTAQLEQSGVLRILFYSLFVVPVYLMCYSCSVVWYQSLADCMFKARKSSSSAPLSKAVVDGAYATAAWLCLFIQVQLLSSIIPMFLTYALSFLESRSLYGELMLLVDLKEIHLSWSWCLRMIYPLTRSLTALILMSCILFSRCLGLFLLSVLYGWYGFDPHWIATNVNPDARFGIIEKHWAYFLGFGAPYVVLVKTTSFFVGYGWFLALFPFCIMLGGICDYSAPYKMYTTPLPSIRVFKIAQTWTLSALKIAGKNAKLSSTSNIAANGKKIV